MITYIDIFHLGIYGISIHLTNITYQTQGQALQVLRQTTQGPGTHTVYSWRGSHINR